jgi:hypothetical protein
MPEIHVGILCEEKSKRPVGLIFQIGGSTMFYLKYMDLNVH